MREKLEKNFEGLLPPRDAHGGFVPIWSHPMWDDEERDHVRRHFGVKMPNDIDWVRPAMLPIDANKHPTGMAQRFGIHPVEPGGHSRLSPTPQSRVNPSKGTIDGVEVFPKPRGQRGQFDELALTGRDFQKMDNRHLRFVRKHMFEEAWQSNFWDGFTTNELVAAGYFTLSRDDIPNDLPRTLHSFLKREKWNLDDSTLAFPMVNRDDYGARGTVDKWRTEYDVADDDRLWAALQPTLQIASKMLDTPDPTTRAIFDMGCRAHDVERHPPGETTIRLSREEDSVLNLASSTPSEDFKPIKHTTATINKHVRLRFCSWEPAPPGSDPDENTMGNTPVCMPRASWHEGEEDLELRILLSADLVWRLLTERFSPAEKATMHVMLAVTIVHEFMHAAQGAGMAWLSDPREMAGITDERDIKYCADVCKVFFRDWNKRQDEVVEPEFEDDVRCELGFAWEERTLGGGLFPPHENLLDKPLSLLGYGGIARRTTAPVQKRIAENEREVFDYHTYTTIGFAKRFLSNGFWESGVKRFGTALWRDIADPAPKVVFDPLAELTREGGMRVGDDEDLEFFNGVNAWLDANGYGILQKYVAALVYEMHQFEIVVVRYMGAHQDQKYLLPNRVLAQDVNLLFTETELTVTYLIKKGRLSSADKKAFETYKKAFDKHASNEAKAHRVSLREKSFPYRLSARGNLYKAKNQPHLLEYYEPRLFSALLDYTQTTEAELVKQENLLCDMLTLPQQMWSKFDQALPGIQAFWEAKLIQTAKEIKKLLDYATKPPYSEIQSLAPSRLKMITQYNRYAALAELTRLLDPRSPDFSTKKKQWRDKLAIAGAWRKSRRPPSERLYVAAKEDILQLDEEGISLLKELHDTFKEKMSLLDCHTWLPEEDGQHLRAEFAQRWTGLLDGVLETVPMDELFARAESGDNGLHEYEGELMRIARTKEAKRIARADAFCSGLQDKMGGKGLDEIVEHYLTYLNERSFDPASMVMEEDVDNNDPDFDEMGRGTDSSYGPNTSGRQLMRKFVQPNPKQPRRPLDREGRERLKPEPSLSIPRIEGERTPLGAAITADYKKYAEGLGLNEVAQAIIDGPVHPSKTDPNFVDIPGRFPQTEVILAGNITDQIISEARRIPLPSELDTGSSKLIGSLNRAMTRINSDLNIAKDKIKGARHRALNLPRSILAAHKKAKDARATDAPERRATRTSLRQWVRDNKPAPKWSPQENRDQGDFAMRQIFGDDLAEKLQRMRLNPNRRLKRKRAEQERREAAAKRPRTKDQARMMCGKGNPNRPVMPLRPSRLSKPSRPSQNTSTITEEQSGAETGEQLG